MDGLVKQLVNGAEILTNVICFTDDVIQESEILIIVAEEMMDRDVAGLTAFYVARMWLLAFWGEPRTEDARHAHESPAVMTLPLWLLAIPSVVLGWVAQAAVGVAYSGLRGQLRQKQSGSGTDA